MSTKPSPPKTLEKRIVKFTILLLLLWGSWCAREWTHEKPAETPPNPVGTPAKLPPAMLRHPPVAIANENIVAYWRTSELYENRERWLVPKESLPQKIAHPVTLSWRHTEGGPYRIQMAADDLFTQELSAYQTSARDATFPQVRLGVNRWRVKAPGTPWSVTAAFTVQGKRLPGAPGLQPIPSFIVSFGEGVTVPLAWTAPPFLSTGIVEVSADPKFKHSMTRAHRAEGSKFTLELPGPGIFHLRVAGVDAYDRIGEFSGVKTIEVGAPPLLTGPVLPSEKLVYYLNGKPARLGWRAPAGATRNVVSILKDGRLVGEFETAQQALDFARQTPGTYTYQVTSIDLWERKGASSKIKSFELRPEVVGKTPVLEKREPAQEPAQEAAPEAAPAEADIPGASMAARLPTPALRPVFLNALYSSPKIQVEGASFGMFSSEQASRGEALPLAATMTLRWAAWWKNLGLEWNYKSKVFNYNGAAQAVSPSSVEGRLAVRTTFDWDWWKHLREIQVSAVLSFESYRNPQSLLYSPGYDLVKTGFQLEFPVASRWQSGGEVLFGLGREGSRKYEISGHLDYFMNRQWTLGVGYRAHAFDAGSVGTTPLGILPYREAYGEGFTMMSYRY